MQDSAFFGHVMVVEDEEFAREFLSFYLTKLGFEVTLAKDGLIALEKLEHSNYNLLIVDYVMPNMNGIQFIQRLRKNELYESLPVILFTSMGDENIRNILLDLGNSYYLEKPFNNEAMLKVLNRIFGENP